MPEEEEIQSTKYRTLQYLYELPRLHSEDTAVAKFLNGWKVSGVTAAESGQPYSVIDFSGAVGSIFYGSNDFITNPIVPLAPGATPASALAHGNAGTGAPFLNPAAFAIRFLQPGQDGVPPCGLTTGGTVICDSRWGARGVSRWPYT